MATAWALLAFVLMSDAFIEIRPSQPWPPASSCSWPA